MKKRWKYSICICLSIVLPLLSLASQEVIAKQKQKEKVNDFDGSKWVIRRDYGLIAKNVSSVKIGSYANLWEVFLKQKGEKRVKEVDLFHKKKSKFNYYTMNVVFKNAKNYFPMMQRSLCIDQKNCLLLTGEDVCHLFADHSTNKECKQSFGKYKNQIVEKGVDSDMLAYVKNNRLYLTGYAAIPPKDGECYKYKTVRSFFEGKGNKIKEVVCGKFDGYGISNVFVLMKDGSVWGMGSNKFKMLSQSNQKYYSDFIKIIPKGIKKIAANSQNVAAIKNNSSLYVWGKTLRSRKKVYSFRPKKIAKNVKEVSLSDQEFEGGTVLVYLKRNAVAYGLGENADYALTDRYKKGWNKKPVFLRKKIKHVYAAPRATLLLDKKGKLYWTGTQDGYNQYA